MRILIDADIQVNSDGSVVLPSGRISFGSKSAGGYMRVQVRGNFHYVHRLVAQMFIPNPENKPFINHKDMNRANNNVDNLERVDNGENVKHGYENNQNRLQMQCGNAKPSKISREQVLWVVENLGKLSQASMARVLGVNGRVIYHIKNGITHRDITGLDRRVN